MANPTTKQTQPEDNREEGKKNRQENRKEFPSKDEGVENRKPSLVTPRQSTSSQGIDEDPDLTDVESDAEDNDSVGNLNQPYGETQRRTENPAKDSNV